MTGKPNVVVYGATGHTGQGVVSALAARGLAPLLAGRDRGALERVARRRDGAWPIAVAGTSDADALHRMLEGADVLVNCAGPHADTSFALASAAIDRGAHYLDTNAVEQLAARRLFDELAAAARHAGVAVVPGMATFGGIGDLMASRAARGLARATAITVSYLVDGWIPTRGSQVTAARTQAAPRLTFDGGRFSTAVEPARVGAFDFGPPIGVRSVVENYPGIDVATIPQHITADRVAVQLALSTLQEFRAVDPELAARTRGDVRKMTEFVVAVDVRHAEGERRRVARGRDIYGFTATLLVHAVERLARGSTRSGVLSPAQAFDAGELLGALSTQGLERIE